MNYVSFCRSKKVCITSLFSLHHWLSAIWLWYVLVWFSLFLLLRILWASWISRFIVFIKFEKFSTIMPLNIFSIFPSLFCTSVIPVINVLGCFIMSHSSLMLCSFFQFFSSLFHCGSSLLLSSDLLIFSPFFQLYWSMIEKLNCKIFKMYNMMIWYDLICIHILKGFSPIKLIN